MDAYCCIVQALHCPRPMVQLKSLQEVMTAVHKDDSARECGTGGCDVRKTKHSGQLELHSERVQEQGSLAHLMRDAPDQKAETNRSESYVLALALDEFIFRLRRPCLGATRSGAPPRFMALCMEYVCVRIGKFSTETRCYVLHNNLQALIWSCHKSCVRRGCCAAYPHHRLPVALKRSPNCDKSVLALNPIKRWGQRFFDSLRK